MRVRLGLRQQAETVQFGDDRAARGEAVLAFEAAHERRIGDAVQLGHRVDDLGERDPALPVEHRGHRQAMPLADAEIVEVVRGRDLDRPGALRRVRVAVRDDRNAAADQGQDRGRADQILISLVVGVNRDPGVAEHRLGAGGRDRDEAGPARPAIG